MLPDPAAGDTILYGFLGSLSAGLGAVVGAVGVFVVRSMSPRAEDALLSSAVGVMLAATFFSLLAPALELAGARIESRALAFGLVAFGLASGALLLWLLHRVTPHEHFVSGRDGPQRAALRRIWLFVIAITIHNLPEGMAVGVGFGGDDLDRGITLALGIGLQNIPEGLAVAVALVTVGYSRAKAFAIATASGLVEPIGGVIGAAAVSFAEPALPWTLGFAAGAMLFIISGEIIPETHRRGFETTATFSLIVGFIVMMGLDFSLA